MSVSNGNQNKLQNNNEADLTINRLASVGQIAAGIAHEVKNPLTAVKGFLQLLKEESPHTYVDLAYSQLEDALQTLQNLLHVSKPDLQVEPFTSINLCSEIESLLYLFKDQSYDIVIDTHFSDCNERIYGKKNQLKKAFFNLIKNAFEAMQDNKGTIKIKHYKSKNVLKIILSDTGIGIPKEKIDLLGTPFFTSKAEGTGMGLTQVFSTIYEHGGKISVKSEVGKGTTFTIQFPINQYTNLEVIKLNLLYEEKQCFEEFYSQNKNEFQNLLITKGKSMIDTVESLTQNINQEYLLQSASEIVDALNEFNEHGLIMHAKEHGRNWAKNNLELILKLEWHHLLRETYWDFLYNFHRHLDLGQDETFELEKKVNFNFDSYIRHFSTSFSEYKDELLRSQREVIDELSVPVIPLSDSMAILPIIGTVDTFRAKKIQENVLVQVHKLRLKHIIIDLSGTAYMDTAVVGHLFKIVNGINIQGCKAIITGIRPEITNTIVELGIELDQKVETRGTLQQALEAYKEYLG
ncbi:ATP-binding protein [Ammoniphilus sp. CFH 90114]|uniref:ATP-binding protein n=1 Tax=Ammoniphilus sp. CFH 90114 TaxID=2493665 RepID=UPI0013E94755|nr:ATP-binding protein [Ammoniphilus sp. CFH 90114]